MPGVVHRHAGGTLKRAARFHQHDARTEVRGHTLLLGIQPTAIERQHDRPEPRHGVEHHDVLDGVAQRHTHHVARRIAQAGEMPGAATHGILQLGIGERCVALLDGGLLPAHAGMHGEHVRKVGHPGRHAPSPPSRP
ncbi:hypothetical protein IMZ29_15400 [Achromobacter sp. GG226]|nr:hypothetical protein [Verticiella sp. GG226]MBU4611874.1 hypothetical protein [Verticiella sp. GG226]